MASLWNRACHHGGLVHAHCFIVRQLAVVPSLLAKGYLGDTLCSRGNNIPAYPDYGVDAKIRFSGHRFLYLHS